MHKKLLSVAVSVALLASPIVASAQTVSASETTVIAALEQLVTTLTQQLESLLAARQHAQMAPVAASAATSTLLTYANSQFGFSMQYPSDANLDASKVAEKSFVANIQNGTVVATFGPLLGSFNATESGWGTNGVISANGTLTVSVSTDTKDVATCMTAPSGGEMDATSITVKNIQGIDYLSYEIDQPATAMEALYHTYTTLHKGVCFSINSTIQAGASGHMNAVDGAANNAIIAKLQSSVDAIAQTFQFADSSKAPSASDFTATPRTGTAPLTVKFTQDLLDASQLAIDFGDGTTCAQATTSEGGCSWLSHTYKTPGTYTASLDSTTEMDGASRPPKATLTVTVAAASGATGAGSACMTYSSLRKGDTDDTTSGQVSQLQSFLGMANVTGYYGAQTSIAYSNKCGSLGNAQPTSVAGMSKYTDSDFGFSFWYPSGWFVTQQAVADATSGGWYQDGTIVKRFTVANPSIPSNGVTIDEFVSTDAAITELGSTKSASPVGVDQKYFFSTSTWMYENLTGTPNGSVPAGTITPADISANTMGGLHVFSGAARFGADSIIPLSAYHFVVVKTNDAGGAIDQNAFADTIVATNPAVAIPVSTTQQVATIQAELQAYVNQ